MKTINLEEILWNAFYNNGIPKPTYTLAEITQKAVKEAMKEACKQTLELASENAKIIYNPDTDEGSLYDLKIVDKQSILDVINKIK